MMIKLIITGACGRMGGAVLNLAAADPAFVITHIVEAATHPLSGTMIAAGSSGATFPLEGSLAHVVDDSDVIIDFTQADASILNFRLASERGKAIVIGTTGISPDSLGEMRNLQQARAVVSPNMSIGVNILFTLAEQAARILGPDYDTEIVEMHHRWKKDAPSGTAVKLKELIMATSPSREWIEVSGRRGMVGERRPDEIGLLSVRAGDIVGEHTVLFAGVGERLEITHRAYSRENFAHGALAAAKWIVRQERGVYDMRDVLGLTGEK
jgi:4-hydroxy-tetrahydrodipicolinate reductase